MKKYPITFLILLLIPSLCFGASYKKKITLQGGYKSVASILVEPIPVQSEGFRVGMPFPIEDPSAQFDSSETGGRQIATWSILTNQDFRLDITAEALHNYNDTITDGAYTKPLGYILRFTYDLSYTSGETGGVRASEIKIAVDGTTESITVKDINMLDKLDIKPNSLSGFAKGNVYFMFDYATSETIKNPDNQLLKGNYNALVTLTLKVGK